MKNMMNARSSRLALVVLLCGQLGVGCHRSSEENPTIPVEPLSVTFRAEIQTDKSIYVLGETPSMSVLLTNYTGSSVFGVSDGSTAYAKVFDDAGYEIYSTGPLSLTNATVPGQPGDILFGEKIVAQFQLQDVAHGGPDLAVGYYAIECVVPFGASGGVIPLLAGSLGSELPHAKARMPIHIVEGSPSVKQPLPSTTDLDVVFLAQTDLPAYPAASIALVQAQFRNKGVADIHGVSLDGCPIEAEIFQLQGSGEVKVGASPSTCTTGVEPIEVKSGDSILESIVMPLVDLHGVPLLPGEYVIRVTLDLNGPLTISVLQGDSQVSTSVQIAGLDASVDIPILIQ